MRVLLLTAFICASCASAPPRRADTGYDPELFEICGEDAVVDVAPVCHRSEEGLWTTGMRPSSALQHGSRALEDGSYEEAVRTLGQTATYDGLDDECGRLQAQWLRGQAFAKLGRYDDALRDYGRVIMRGRGTPFMAEAPKLLDALEGKAPGAAVAACRKAVIR